MNTQACAFLIAVLGKDGFKALYKASQRASELENAIVPRAILAWLNVAGIADYEGELPGVEDTYINFTKSEEQFHGAISIGDHVFRFREANVFHVASCIAVALGADADKLSPSLRDLDLNRLGKTIDVLAKARFIAEALRKSPDRFELLDIDGGPEPEEAFRREKEQQEKEATVQPAHDTHKPQIPTQDRTGHPYPTEEEGGWRGVTDAKRVKAALAADPARSWNWDIAHDNENNDPQCNSCGKFLSAHGGHWPKPGPCPSDVNKVELPGKTHMPTEQVGQTAPQAPQKQPKLQAPKPGVAKSEPLQKMALIHDDANNPAYVWRIAHEDTNVGPFAHHVNGASEDAKHNEMRLKFGDADANIVKEGKGKYLYGYPPDAKADAVKMLPGVRKWTKDGSKYHIYKQPASKVWDAQGEYMKSHTHKEVFFELHPSYDHSKAIPEPFEERPKEPKKPALRVEKNQLERTCPQCAFSFFNGSNFTGCFCFRALGKSTTVTEDNGGVILEFGAAWDEDSILTLIRSLKGEPDGR